MRIKLHKFFEAHRKIYSFEKFFPSNEKFKNNKAIL